MLPGVPARGRSLRTRRPLQWQFGTATGSVCPAAALLLSSILLLLSLAAPVECQWPSSGSVLLVCGVSHRSLCEDLLIGLRHEVELERLRELKRPQAVQQRGLAKLSSVVPRRFNVILVRGT